MSPPPHPSLATTRLRSVPLPSSAATPPPPRLPYPLSLAPPHCVRRSRPSHRHGGPRRQALTPLCRVRAGSQRSQGGSTRRCILYSNRSRPPGQGRDACGRCPRGCRRERKCRSAAKLRARSSARDKRWPRSGARFRRDASHDGCAVGAGGAGASGAWEPPGLLQRQPSAPAHGAVFSSSAAPVVRPVDVPVWLARRGHAPSASVVPPWCAAGPRRD